MLKKITGMFLIFLTVLALGTFLLAVVYLLPTVPMKEHVRESLDSFMAEGDNPFLLDGYKGSSLDNSTDAIMLGNAVFESEQPFYKSAMLVERAKDEEGDTMVALQKYILEDDRHLTGDYSRYWHGYLIFLKPLLLVLNFGQIRILNGMFFFVILALNLFGFLRSGRWRGCIAFLFAVAGLYPMVIPYSLQYSGMFYVGLTATAVILYKSRRMEEKKLWESFFLVTGMCASYLDFLTYPLFTLGMPLVLCIVYEKHELKKLIGNCICWACGYFGMWMGKWAIGSCLTGENLWIKALETANLRVSGAVNEEHISRVMAILRNFYIYAGVLGILLFVIMIIWLLSGMRRYRKEVTVRNLLPLCMAACMPIVWYLLLANHSYIHYWYTFRILTVSIFAVAMVPEYLYQKQMQPDIRS